MSFMIMFKGEIKPDRVLATVQDEFSRLEKLPRELTDRVFTGSTYILKDNPKGKEISEYLPALERMGMKVYLVDTRPSGAIDFERKELPIIFAPTTKTILETASETAFSGLEAPEEPVLDETSANIPTPEKSSPEKPEKRRTKVTEKEYSTTASPFYAASLTKPLINEKPSYEIIKPIPSDQNPRYDLKPSETSDLRPKTPSGGIGLNRRPPVGRPHIATQTPSSLSAGFNAEDYTYDIRGLHGLSREAPSLFDSSIDGRYGRLNYINAMLVIGLMWVPVCIIAIILMQVLGTTGMVISLVLMLFLVVLNIRVTILRLHDVNLSGWFVILWVLFSGLMTLVLMIIPGTKGQNNYGAPSVQGNFIGLILYCLLCIITVVAALSRAPVQTLLK